jgi:hypothetical protein
MIFSPIFKSNSGDISLLKYAKGIGELFAITDRGVINKIRTIPNNAYGTGLTEIFAQILDGDGTLSQVSYDFVYYDLYKAVVSIFPESFSVVKENVNCFGINKSTKAVGVYISDVLKADEDFGFWKTLTWTQSLNEGRAVVALKVSDSESDILLKDWQYYVSVESSAYGQYGGSMVSESLDRFNLKGRYMQFKVTLESQQTNTSPSVNNFVISYAAKHSVFFFSRKFKIDKSYNINDILMTASFLEPQNTELRFGITNSNSSNWEDYKIVNLNELVTLPSDWGNIMKVGIKMSSYTDKTYPVVQEFAFLLGSDNDNNLNRVL